MYRPAIAFSFLLASFVIVAARAEDAVSVKSHPDSANWQDLFTRDLSNAIYPKGVTSAT